MADVVPLARGSNWHSKRPESPRCLFCGSGTPWFDMGVPGSPQGCICRWATAVRDGKLQWQMLHRGGRPVITRCSPELWEPIVAAGIVLKTGAVVGKELDDASRAAFRTATTAKLKATNAEVANATEQNLPSAKNPRVETDAVNQQPTETLDDDIAKDYPETRNEPESDSSVTNEPKIPGGGVMSGRLRVTCAECGKEFFAQRSTAKYCSVNCRARAQRLRRAEEYHSWTGLEVEC